MESYSQCGQDIFVLNILNSPGTFLDLGCYLPDKINNTFLLESMNWRGISIDITDYSNEWKKRKNKFINIDCFSVDYKLLLDQNYPNSNNLIDYLSIDMELLGDRFSLLKRVIDSGYEFKIITIEHDSHLGEDFVKIEKEQQVNLLKSKGYYLLCSNVSNYKSPDMFYEDWWINPKYINIDDVSQWESNCQSCVDIFNKMNIEYTISDISKNWDDYKK